MVSLRIGLVGISSERMGLALGMFGPGIEGRRDGNGEGDRGMLGR